MRVVGLLVDLLLFAAVQAASSISLSLTPPSNASDTIIPSFVSFSIEFASFPDFAGNSSAPNTFSYNLLTNLGDIQGSNPIIRVGGNTQDYATFNASQRTALIGTFDYSRSSDYPTTISIGPSYFDSYSTWPGLTYLHGFNLAKNGSVGYNTLIDEVPLVCKALSGGRLAYFQLGNEPDLYKTSSQGPVRPPSWNEADYVDEWLNKTGIVHDLVQQNCPEVIADGKFKWYAPSFGGAGNSLNIVTTFQAGLDTDQDIAFIDSHNYIGGATQPGVTLQKTLMNHTSTVLSVNKHLNESTILSALGLPSTYILGETNSLYNEGAPGLSNSFGAALWGVDFNLYCASTAIRRVHMHQGTNYRYASWQPVQTVNATLGTKPPYYGNIGVASFLGNLTKETTRVANIDLGDIHNTAYAAYVDGKLTRVALIQLTEYNYTTMDGSQPMPRPQEMFDLQLPMDSGISEMGIRRLMANGSDAISGATFDGYSYNWELDNGKPVLLSNVTRGETVSVGSNGMFSVNVPWSSAVILDVM